MEALLFAKDFVNVKPEDIRVISDFDITTEINKKLVTILGYWVEFVGWNYFPPFIKPNMNLKYVNTASNHPFSIIKHIPLGAQWRLSQNSSNKLVFNEKKKKYVSILKEEGHSTGLYFKKWKTDNDNSDRRKRRINIIWFNPLFNLQVKTNIGKILFNLLIKHFTFIMQQSWVIAVLGI